MYLVGCDRELAGEVCRYTLFGIDYLGEDLVVDCLYIFWSLTPLVGLAPVFL